MLKPPKNYREINIRCCGTCAFVEYVDETDRKTNMPTESYLRRCRRDHDICQFEAETFYFRVCDYYKQA